MTDAATAGPGIKGRISISEFIREVEAELMAAQALAPRPCFEVTDVTLEVSFALDASARAGAKLFVLDLSGESKAQQMHKVVVKLKPLTAAQIAAIEGSQAMQAAGRSGTLAMSGDEGSGDGGRGPVVLLPVTPVPPVFAPALWAAPAAAPLESGPPAASSDIDIDDDAPAASNDIDSEDEQHRRQVTAARSVGPTFAESRPRAGKATIESVDVPTSNHHADQSAPPHRPVAPR